MLIYSSIEPWTLFEKMLVLSARFAFLAIYQTDNSYRLCVTSMATEMNFDVSPGKLFASIAFDKLHTGELDDSDRTEIQYRVRRYNEVCVQN